MQADLLYSVGCLLLVAACVSLFVLESLGKPSLFWIVTVLLLSGLLSLSVWFALRKWRYIALVWSTNIGRCCFGIATGLVMFAARVQAREQIVEVTRLDPTSFHRATTVLSAILSLKIWLMIAGFFLLLYLTYVACRTTFNSLTKRKQNTSLKDGFIGGTATLGIIMFALLYIGIPPKSLQSLWQHTVAQALLVTEFYAESSCSNQRLEKVAFLNNGDIAFLEYVPEYRVYVSYSEPCEQYPRESTSN